MLRSTMAALFATAALSTAAFAQGPIFSADRARRHVAVLADDSMGGRALGSPGAAAAARYLAAQLLAYGLTPAGDSGTYLQRVPMSRVALDTAGTLVLSAGGKTTTLRAGREFTALFNTSGTSATAGSVWGNLDDTAGIRRTFAAGAGKVILLNIIPGHGLALNYFPAATPPIAIIALYSSAQFRARAARAGAGQIVAGEAAPRRLGFLPVLAIDRDSLVARLGPIAPGAPGSAAPFAFTINAGDQRTPVDGWNVAAIRRGTDTASYVALLAHYDHIGVVGGSNAACRAVGADSICNGADNNASGAAALLLFAEAAAAGPPPPRSLLFLWSTAGEFGHVGAQWAAGHLPVPADSVAAALEFEMVGRGAPDTLYDVGTGRISAVLSHLADSIGSSARDPIRWNHSPAPAPGPSRPPYCQSDLGAFVHLGIPGLQLNGGPYPEYRRPDDAVGTIDAAKIARVTAFAAGLANTLAMAPGRPAVDSAGGCH